MLFGYPIRHLCYLYLLSSLQELIGYNEATVLFYNGLFSLTSAIYETWVSYHKWWPCTQKLNFYWFDLFEENNILNIVIGQDVGQNIEFREVFDVTVARAVAEMRVLGMYHFIGSINVSVGYMIWFLWPSSLSLSTSWVLSPPCSCWWFVCCCERSCSGGTCLI